MHQHGAELNRPNSMKCPSGGTNDLTHWGPCRRIDCPVAHIELIHPGDGRLNLCVCRIPKHVVFSSSTPRYKVAVIFFCGSMWE